MEISTKQISKLCSKYLRDFSNHHGFKLKSTHAHELVAAIFGYQTNTSLLEDERFPLNNFQQANVILQLPRENIDQRRKKLQDLPQELPDSNKLIKVVYDCLKSEKLIGSKVLQYDNLEKDAILLAHEYYHQQQLTKLYLRPFREEVKVEVSDEGILLIITPYHQPIRRSDFKRNPTMQFKNISTSLSTTIWLKRIAGYIGYAKPKINARPIPMLYHTQS